MTPLLGQKPKPLSLTSLSDAEKSRRACREKSPNNGRIDLTGDRGRTRTSDLLLRRQLLYPAELRDRMNSF